MNEFPTSNIKGEELQTGDKVLFWRANASIEDPDFAGVWTGKIHKIIGGALTVIVSGARPWPVLREDRSARISTGWDFKLLCREDSPTIRDILDA